MEAGSLENRLEPTTTTEEAVGEVTGDDMELLVEAGGGLELSDEDQLLEWFAVKAANIDLLQLDERRNLSLLADSGNNLAIAAHPTDKQRFSYLVEGVMMMVVGSFGILLNIFAVCFFIRQRSQRTFHRLLLLLAVADNIHIISSLLSFSLPALHTGFRKHSYQYTLPYTLPIAQSTMVMSIYLTISLTLERYLSIVYPLLTLSLRSGSSCLSLSCPSIIFSMLFTLPNYFMLYTEDRRDINILHSTTEKDFPDIRVRWADFRSNEAYITVYVLWLHLIFITIIPFGTLLALNIIIYRKLTEASMAVRRTGDEQVRRREVRMARISITIVIIFLLCHILKLVPSLCEIVTGDPGLVPGTVELSHLLITFNSSVNFLVYYLASGNSFAEVFCFRSRTRHPSSPTCRSTFTLLPVGPTQLHRICGTEGAAVLPTC